MYQTRDVTLGLHGFSILYSAEFYKNQVMEIKNNMDEICTSREMVLVLKATNQMQKFLNIYEAGLKQIVTKLEILSKDFQFEKKHKPIETIKYRVKDPGSIIQKLERKEIEFSYKAVVENIKDVAGIRVTCPFIADVYEIADLLCSQEDITLIETKDYIEHPKPNGYRSLHLVVKIPVYFPEFRQEVVVELQIRTVGMDSWASLEHQLCYKKDYNKTEEVVAELKRCADVIADNDRRMQRIASKLCLFAEDGENRPVVDEKIYYLEMKDSGLR